MKSWIYQRAEDWVYENRNKMEYYYSGDNIAEERYYSWKATTSSWELIDQDFYEYDEWGNMIEWRDDGGASAQYEYERGDGNVEVFQVEPEEAIFQRPELTKNNAEHSRDEIPLMPRFL